MSFSIPIKKDVIETQEDQKKKVITYRLRLIDTARLMNRGLSVLVDNLSELTIPKCEDVKNKDIIVKAKKENGKDYICLRCN